TVVELSVSAAAWGAPRAGAWIETRFLLRAPRFLLSPPARGRGLKRMSRGTALHPAASPPARGRGLKPKRSLQTSNAKPVAPRAGAWIETVIRMERILTIRQPARLRSLGTYSIPVVAVKRYFSGQVSDLSWVTQY
ncbi:MAG: hypothetical protein ACOYOS_17435, partial [Syntrophales bacterium]